jgi:hypothetical protein
VFVGFSRRYLLGILLCIGLTAGRLYKSFGVKGLMHPPTCSQSIYQSSLCYSRSIFIHISYTIRYNHSFIYVCRNNPKYTFYYTCMHGKQRIWSSTNGMMCSLTCLSVCHTTLHKILSFPVVI